jgi:hypothetical protein
LTESERDGEAGDVLWVQIFADLAQTEGVGALELVIEAAGFEHRADLALQPRGHREVLERAEEG